MNSISLREASPADALACAQILNQWIDATAWMPRCHPPKDVERHYREFVLPTREVIVAEQEGRTVGFIAIDSAHHCITGLYIRGDQRGQGIGTRLLDHAKTRWPAALELWTFAANEGAQRFYQRHGFREVRRTDGDNEECLPDILFRWTPTK